MVRPKPGEHSPPPSGGGSGASQSPPDASVANDVGWITIIRTKRLSVRPRGQNQRQYVSAIGSHDINFGIGPAGTGKTYLAVACAVQALLNEQVKRILLVRPAVEAGERLGFLPGDLSQKVDPYLRPLYDALYEMLGFETVTKHIERHIIEVAPLAFMRGRTLNHAFIILDEAQNTTREQMKMFLTRIGFGSTAVVTGDTSQIDLPQGHAKRPHPRAIGSGRRAGHHLHGIWQQGRRAAPAGATRGQPTTLLSSGQGPLVARVLREYSVIR